ncbi:hypothetical protein FJU08_14095 [Martelella alba]|uniref:DUF5330 domain-containing protein n=1 Tax=Martelella alba TaxID=2590451 RepID=A0A506U8N1_9HYPH|nr:DUF5330 domain-containing protein [Martelella alba]TPW29461.1 hypothetical protein FJU08_14095 [Martelella alba]
MIRFLLKTAFLFFCLLLILPFFSTYLTGEPASQDNAEAPNAAEIGGAVTAARGTIEYMSGLCGEKPEVCVNGVKIIDFLRHRAGEGANVAYRYLGQHFDDGDVQNTNVATISPDTRQVRLAAEPPEAVPAKTATPSPDTVITGAIEEAALSQPQAPVAPAPPETLTAAARPDLAGIRLDVPLPTPRPY